MEPEEEKEKEEEEMKREREKVIIAGVVHVYVGKIMQYMLSYKVSSVHVTTPDKVWNLFYPNLRKHFNVQSAFPYLRRHELITADQQEKLMLPSTNAERVDQLAVWLPQQGQGYLKRFICCLRESASDVPVHEELADQLEDALTNRDSTAQGIVPYLSYVLVSSRRWNVTHAYFLPP